MFLVVLSVVFCATSVCDGANILAIIPTPSFSHQVAFRELWKELSLQGNKVTVITTDPIDDPNLKNLKEINMKSSYEVWNKKYSFSKEASRISNLLDLYHFFHDLVTDVSDNELSQPDLKDLIYGSDKYKFDVVMIEDIYLEYLAFGKIYNCPTILLGAIGITLHNHHYVGNNIHPVLNTDMNIPYAGELNFRERLLSTLFHWYLMYFNEFYYLPIRQQLIDQHFGNVTSVRIEDLLSEVDFMMINEIPLFKGVRSHGPTTVHVGGRNHMEQPKPLPKVNIILIFLLNHLL